MLSFSLTIVAGNLSEKDIFKNQKRITDYFAPFLLIHCFNHPFHSPEAVVYSFFKKLFLYFGFFSTALLCPSFPFSHKGVKSNLKPCKKTIPRTTLHSEK